MSRVPHCTPFRTVPWYTRTPPLTTKDYESMAAQRMCIQATNAVFLFCDNQKWSYRERVSRGSHYTPFRVVPWYTSNLPLATANYIHSHVKHVALFSGLREDFIQNRRRAQIAHGPPRLRCVDGLFTWCWHSQRIHRHGGSRIFLKERHAICIA